MSATIPPLKRPSSTNPFRMDWHYFSGVVSIHLLSLLALIPWLFSWEAFAVGMVSVYFFGRSINLCYHRQLTHRSFKTPLWLEHYYVVLALCCLQDTPATWVANHRMHHANSDKENDPHSPLVSFWWSHFGWLFRRNMALSPLALHGKYARDILSDPWYLRLERGMMSEFIFIGHALLFTAAGAVVGWMQQGTWLGSLQMALSMLIWGVIVRTYVIWHITQSVNSLAHLFGYRSYETTDNSRNNWLVGILAMGEGWHNNHHAEPSAARQQRRWWEIDMIFYEIWLLERLGLATDVVKPRHKVEVISA